MHMLLLLLLAGLSWRVEQRGANARQLLILAHLEQTLTSAQAPALVALRV